MYLHLCVYIYTHMGALHLGALEILKNQFTTALSVSDNAAFWQMPLVMPES